MLGGENARKRIEKSKIGVVKICEGRHLQCAITMVCQFFFVQYRDATLFITFSAVVKLKKGTMVAFFFLFASET